MAPFLFVICLDYVLRISADKYNEYGLVLELARSRRFPTKKITDVDYDDDIAVLSDNSYNAQKLLHILEQSAAFIDYMSMQPKLNVCATIRMGQ